jgi:hypothetical protein
MFVVTTNVTGVNARVLQVGRNTFQIPTSLDFVHRIALKNEHVSITEHFPNIRLKDGEAVTQLDPTENFSFSSPTDQWTSGKGQTVAGMLCPFPSKRIWNK